MRISDVQIAVCNRLQFLFIDEFQDVDTIQFEIFDRIRKSNKTNIYAVGDPEQYIMGYTYQGKSKPSFANIPINRFVAERKPKIENYRASSEIVTFTNQFHFQIKQKSIKGSDPQANIYFIAKNSLTDIISIYQNLCASITCKEGKPLHFYLSFENKAFEDVSTNFNLIPLQIQNITLKTAFNEALDLICNLVGLTKKQISENYGVEPLEIRKMGIRLLDAITRKEVSDKESLTKFVQDKLKMQLTTEYDLSGKDLLRSLILMMQNDQNILANHQYSSIHKAKGLEADTVLVVARNKNELTHWLMTDKDARATDNSDSCRVGYVAFTRTKTLLCIACLEPIDEDTTKMLNQLGISLN